MKFLKRNFFLILQISSVNHVAVMIPSTPENYYRRMIVRSTWANQKYLVDKAFTFSFIFIVGQSTSREAAELVELEQEWFHDIVIGNFIGKLFSSLFPS